MDTEAEDVVHRGEAIRFFKSLITHRLKLGIDTRPVNFAGNIGRHMTRPLKKWFLNKYPNNSDYVKFFLENDSVFSYDCISGNVDIITTFDHSFERPERLIQLEELCSDPSIDLIQMSVNVSELELLIVVFKSFVDSRNLKKKCELNTQQLAEDFSEKRFERMFCQLKTIIANPLDSTKKFENNLMKYLETNYSEIFAVDKQRKTIRLQLQVIELFKKVTEIMDDTIYKVFEYLLAKYLERKGPEDVDLLYEMIAKRHPFIVGHIFGRNGTTADEYTLLDFCTFNEKTFELKRVSKDGTTLRLIDIHRPVIEAKAKPVIEVIDVSDKESEDTYNSDDEIYMSDDEVYCSEDEEIKAVSQRFSSIDRN